MLEIMKRDGSLVPFNKDKIVNAINKAMLEVDGILYETDTAEDIASDIEIMVQCSPNTITVETIQDCVENFLMRSERRDVAKAYIRYRYKKEMLRQTHNVYESVLKLVDLNNEELKEENSNKNAVIASTQRDYMAGEVSKDVTRQFLLPEDIREAHDNGIIHFHDADYFAQHVHNCDLVNLEDMLQNGTVINKTLIEKPHSFTTACNIATQIMAVVASGQYGGQSISLTHLAPFVDISRQKIYQQMRQEYVNFNNLKSMEDINSDNEAIIKKITEQRVKEEIARGVQIMQYQINTLNTSNG